MTALSSFLLATSMVAAVSASLTTCTAALAKLGQIGPTCGNGFSDGSPDPDYPRSPATCASTACADYVSSFTESSVKDMATGMAACTGEYAPYNALDEAYLTSFAVGAAFYCGLSTGLTPPPLNTCIAARQKLQHVGPTCGNGNSDGSPDPEYPRTTATCASTACANYVSSFTESSLKDMATGMAACTDGSPPLDEAYLTMFVMGTAAECGLSTGLTPPPLNTCTAALAKSRQVGPTCGNGFSDGSPDPDYPRSPATCASTACADYVSSFTESSLKDMASGFAACTGEYAPYSAYDEAFLYGEVVALALECGLSTGLTPPSPQSGLKLSAEDAQLGFGMKSDGTPKCTIHKVPGEMKLISNCAIEGNA